MNTLGRILVVFTAAASLAFAAFAGALVTPLLPAQWAVLASSLLSVPA